MTAWTHHDPAVRKLIREAQAAAWDEAVDETFRRLPLRVGAPDLWATNPYRKETP